MKKQFLVIVILISCFTIFGNHLYAQTAQPDSAKAEKLKAQLIDAICTCISKEDTSKIKTADDVQGLLMQCFMSDGMSLFMDYATASGVDLTDTKKVQEWGQRIGMELSFKCPTLIKLLMNMAKDPNELKKLQGEADQLQKTDSTKKQ